VGGTGAQPLEQVVADSQRVRDGRQRGVHRADAREEARIDDVQIVELVGLAVHVEDGRRRVQAEANGAGLVGDARDRDLVLEVPGPRNEMVGVHAQVIEHRLQLAVQLLLRLLVVGRVRQADVAVVRERHAVVGCRQILGRQPEVDRVGGDIGQRELRGEHGLERLLALEHLGVGLADHLDVAHRVVEPGHPEVEVVDAQCLLEDRLVRFH
jgi:hypothetical protein